MKKIIILTAALASFVIGANAQTTSTANQDVSLVLSNSIAITFVGTGNGTGTAVTLPFTTVANYTNGVTSTAQQLSVQSNNPFSVSVAANSANFTYSGSVTPAPTMPVSGVLALDVSANTTGGTVASGFNATYAGLTNSTQSIITGGTAGGAQAFSVQYQATPGFAYPAGTYTTNVVYTATQP